MSVLGPLFIPRKDILKVPKVKDNPELEKYLDDLHRRIHTNELAIERWANSAPRLAAVVGPCSISAAMDSTAAPPGERALLPLDGPVNAFFSATVDSTNSQFIVANSGWYIVSATILWDTTAMVGNQAGSVEVLVIKNGDLTPGHEISSTGTSTQIQRIGPPATTISVDYQTISLTTVFAAKDTIQFYGFNFIFLDSGAASVATAKITACALDFLGSTPTTVQ